MFRNRLYYSVKPLIPWSVRMRVRRWFARRKRARVADAWPIVLGSEKPPAGWPGWPDGRQFAFVLTHDVEGPEGLAKVKPLAKRLDTLDGKTIAWVWDYVFRGNEVFEQLEESLRAARPPGRCGQRPRLS